MCSPPASAGTLDDLVLVDQTPGAPLQSPAPSSCGPRYVSGFGVNQAFTVMFEDRDVGGAIASVATTNGLEGFPAGVTPTNISDTHFVVKDWPITIGSTM